MALNTEWWLHKSSLMNCMHSPAGLRQAPLSLSPHLQLEFFSLFYWSIWEIIPHSVVSQWQPLKTTYVYFFFFTTSTISQTNLDSIVGQKYFKLIHSNPILLQSSTLRSISSFPMLNGPSHTSPSTVLGQRNISIAEICSSNSNPQGNADTNLLLYYLDSMAEGRLKLSWGWIVISLPLLLPPCPGNFPKRSQRRWLRN